MKKILSLALLLGMSSMSTLASAEITGPQAKAHIQKRLQYSSKVADKTLPMKTQLGGKKGDVVRPFTASNIRYTVIPGNAPPGALGGARVATGNRITGTVNMKTEAVRTKSVAIPRATDPVE